MRNPSAASGRGVKPGPRRGLKRPPAELAPSSAAEPCASCGEETAVGSVLYSDRHDLPAAAGSAGFLCAECFRRARAVKGSEPSDEAGMQAIASNGLLAGVHLLTGH